RDVGDAIALARALDAVAVARAARSARAARLAEPAARRGIGWQRRVEQAARAGRAEAVDARHARRAAFRAPERARRELGGAAIARAHHDHANKPPRAHASLYLYAAREFG